MAVNQDEFDRLWKGSSMRIGVITILITTVLCFLPNLYLYINYGVFPSFTHAMTAWAMVVTVYGIMYVVEPISFYPVLGMTGTYMAFLTGNIGNLRLPCAAVALNVLEEESGTPEAEMVSTLAIAGSVVTSLLLLSCTAIVGSIVLDALPRAVQNALRFYTVPAIFGAVLAQQGMKYPILVIFGFGIPMFLFYGAPRMGLALPATGLAALAIVCAVFGTILIARVFYKMKIIR